MDDVFQIGDVFQFLLKKFFVVLRVPRGENGQPGMRMATRGSHYSDDQSIAFLVDV